MTYFEAIFYPLAVWSLLGIAAAATPCFCPSVREKKKWPIACFMAMSLLFMLFWRTAIAAGQRHHMVLMVPVMFLSVYLLAFIRASSRRWKQLRHVFWLFPALFVICLGVCMGKTLRVREKPYLTEISRILQQETPADDRLFIAIGNIGGVIPVDPKLQMLRILPENHEISEAIFDQIEQLLSLELFKKRYRTIFLLAVETGEAETFSREWTRRHADRLRLQYEHVNARNDRHYRLYQLTIPEQNRRWKTRAEMLAEFRSKNLLRNPELREWTRLLPDTPEVLALNRRGTRLDLPKEGIPWPTGWDINLQYGWMPMALPVRLRLQKTLAGQNLLRIGAQAPISFALSGELPAGRRYWILSGISCGSSGGGELYGVFHDGNNKPVFRTALQQLDWQQSVEDQLIEVDLRQRQSGAMRLFFRLFFGEGIAKYCFAIEAK